MSQANNLLREAIGVITLTAGGAEYVCTSVQYTLALNKIPAASVVIGCGASLNNTTNDEYSSAEKLLAKVLDKKTAAYLDMIECTLQEKINVGGIVKTTKIFEGVIVIGSVVYQTGTPTARSIRFLCMNKACKLYVKPLTEYINVCGSSLIDTAATTAKMDVKAALEKANQFSQGRESAEQVCENLKSKVLDETIDKMMSAVVDACIMSGSYCPTGKTEDVILSGMNNYIFSDYKINKKTFGSSCRESFLLEVCKFLMQNMQTMSLFDAIYACLTSNTFMLNIIPRWKDKDFKLEIAPSAAWAKKDIKTLSCSEVIAIDSNYNPISCINTPEAFIVNFSDAVEYIRDQNTFEYSGMNGVFSTNAEIQSKFMDMFQNNQKMLSPEMSKKLYKAKMYTAPKWMHPAFIDKSSSSNRTPGSVSDQRTRRTNNSQTNKTVKKSLNLNSAKEVANYIAKALFIHLFGSSDNATLRVLPSVRFGYSKTTGLLEDHIGKLLDVTFEPDTYTDTDTSPLNIRGVLSGITYDYTMGQAGQATYTLYLSCVRPLNSSEESIECPLYVKG